MKKPDYTEPALGWNAEDFKVGLIKFGVAEYSAPTKVNIEAPLRPPAIAFEPDSERRLHRSRSRRRSTRQSPSGSCEGQGLEGRGGEGRLAAACARERPNDARRTMRGERCVWRPGGARGGAQGCGHRNRRAWRAERVTEAVSQ
jgi:hypothetical protein